MLDREFEALQSKVTSLEAENLKLRAEVNPLKKEVERLKDQVKNRSFPGETSNPSGYYCAHCGSVFTKFAVGKPAGFWMNDWRDCGHGNNPKTEYANDFMRPFGFLGSMAAPLIRQHNMEAALSVQRATGQEPFSREDHALAEYVFPHIERATRLQYRMQHLGAQATAGNAALNHIAAPVLVVESDGRVLLSNHAADRICAHSRVLSVRAGKLVSSDLTLQFQRVLTAATRHGQSHAAGLRLRGLHPADYLHVLVVPLAATARLAEPWQRPLALVVIHRQGVLHPTVEQLLQDLFGLTAAEARVARFVADGLTPAEVAQRLMVAVSTIRSHLKVIFSKTGMRRQADLSRLITSIGLLGSGPEQLSKR